MMQQSSLEAYQLITPVLPEKRYEVYQILLEHGPLTNKEIAEQLKWTINRVTPRVKELRDMGIVHRVDQVCDPESGITVNVWGCH